MNGGQLNNVICMIILSMECSPQTNGLLTLVTGACATEVFKLASR